jgi:hypothetical protein
LSNACHKLLPSELASTPLLSRKKAETAYFISINTSTHFNMGLADVGGAEAKG